MRSLRSLQGRTLRNALDTFANFVVLLCVVHFVASYYFTCYHRGYTMDIWHFTLLGNLVIMQLMLPFARSNLNILAVGPQLRMTQAFVTEAYFISTLGYFALLVGGSLWRLHLGIGVRRRLARSVEWISRGSLLMMDSRFVLLVNGTIAIVLTWGVLAYYFSTEGFGFNLRGLLLVKTWLRPIAQFAGSYSNLIGSFCLARFYQRREQSMLWITVLISVGLIFFGERSSVISILSWVALGAFIILGRRLRFSLFVGGIFVGLFLILFLGVLRSPTHSFTSLAAGASAELLYGNSLSDLRDFATILSHWNGHLYFGLTYVAGLFAFIPRVLWDFRDQYAAGAVTASIAGFSPTEHPGLRIGPFGEAYLNLGLTGVVLMGLLVGAITRLIDLRMKQAVTLLPKGSMVVFSYLTVLTLAATLQNSVGASALYTMLLIFLASWATLGVARFLKLTA